MAVKQCPHCNGKLVALEVSDTGKKCEDCGKYYFVSEKDEQPKKANRALG